MPAALAGIDSLPAAARFWQEHPQQLPVIERLANDPARMRVVFAWRAGEHDDVRLSAGFLLDEARRDVALAALPGTDIRYLARVLPADARFSYYFVLPGTNPPRAEAVWQDTGKQGPRDYLADPNARLHYVERGEDGRLRKVSWVSGPAAEDQASLFAAEPAGRWIDHELPSRALGESRPFSVYLPLAAQTAREPLPLLLMFDRETYRYAGRLPSMLDALIAAHRLPPLLAVLISPMDDTRRGRDLPPNAAFQNFIAGELLPYVQTHYRVSRRAADHVIAGSSYGGLAALYTGLSHPELFGKVISQSGSFWWYPACCNDDAAQGQDQEDEPVNAGPDADMGWLIEQFAVRHKVPLQIDMNVGRWEGSLMLIPNRMMHHVLRARGYPVHYEEYSGGHDIAQWRATLPRALERLLARGR